jgi:hypothetical protein
VVSLENLVRGLIEKHLDRLLRDDLATEAKILSSLELSVASKEDYLRGYVVGSLNGTLTFYLQALVKREMTQEDVLELYQRVINGRSSEIEQRIAQVLSK